MSICGWMVFHVWTKWSAPIREKADWSKGGVAQYKYVQWRECLKCKKQQHNTL